MRSLPGIPWRIPMIWRWIEEFSREGAWNMAVDMALFEACEGGASDATVRIYSWKPWCISLGNSQDAREHLDLSKISAAGLQVVRRPTGGRAILHAQEITYSVVAPLNFAPWCGTLGSTYGHISQILLEALRCLGVGAHLGVADPVDSRFSVGNTRAPCFSSSARSEVVWQGRKLVGSAQRRGRRAFLQHGSILVGKAHRDLVQYLYCANQESREQALATLDKHAVSLSEIPGTITGASQISQALRRAWEKSWGPSQSGNYSGGEGSRMQQLRQAMENFL